MTPDYRADNPYQNLLVEALVKLGASVQFPSGYRRVFPLRRMLPRLGPLPDVLHLHWLEPYLKGKYAATKAIYAAKLLLDLLLVRSAGVKVVWTVHNLVGHEQTHPKIEIWTRKRLARLADVIIVHSERARHLVADKYRFSEEGIHVIPHGHYRDAYGPRIPMKEARQELGLLAEGHVFLFFGMVRPYKGVMALLSAWDGSPELQRNTLMIAGRPLDALHEEEIRKAAEGLPGVHLWLKRVPDDQVPTFFSAADTVVLPFERSLTSGSLVLAQTYGCAVVTTLSEDGTHEPEWGATGGAQTCTVALASRLVDATKADALEKNVVLSDWVSSGRRHLVAMVAACNRATSSFDG
ncbi:glycosyltransferase [Limibaculum sp. M0105]|uniref:Glycosyltransferase n=1 Tax=Thermohalobaculum xanthum TaxID=2753746 RepID=A0A8J7M7K4_9RHOB|nr:glycosyltransferase [Thermohalobaculum xanthum]MBK0399758.1 glycosyltransferase [Thermohalobaculum xanthum]